LETVVAVNNPLNTNFWQGKRILLTGHTGFKGGWLAIWLNQMGAKVIGLSLPTTTQPNLFELANVADITENHVCDIRDAEKMSTIIHNARPEIVFHLAAQPLVRASYREPLETFASNVMGTAHVLDALRGLDRVKVAVIITTDKVYQNLEQSYPYRETDALSGYDPYSASKAASEIAIASYRDSFLKEQGVAIASARAGNVIGGGDWSEDRLIPDAVCAWNANQSLAIRRPDAIRPWQHVLEPLHGYLRLAERLCTNPDLAGGYNFGPHTHEVATVREVIQMAQQAYAGGRVQYGDGTEGPHETGWLALEIAKARTQLGVTPKWDLQESITRTMEWYQQQHQGQDARKLCEQDIAAYEAALKVAS
jgi:CDP-glucose 4,6-dehydratase